jgi:uncharacterized membrane protein (Fun14 family)
MIKIISFQPFQNLLRDAQEYHEDKAYIKIKTLKIDREFEFEYKDATEVVDAFRYEYNQATFGFWLLGFSTFVTALFCKFIYAHSVLLRIEQVLYIAGLLIFITAFKKSWRIYILDKNDNVLAYIKQTHRNRNLIPQIIDLIRNKAENLREHTAANPFSSDEEFEHEHIEYDYPEYEKITERFYNNQIIGLRKDPFSENVYSIQYKNLNGKVFRSKTGNNIAGTILSLATLIASVYGGYIFGFGIPFHIPISMPILRMVIGLYILSLLALPLNLIKREVIGLYNKDGAVIYSTHVNRNNKDKVEKIIKYVVSKIPAENKQQQSEEQP